MAKNPHFRVLALTATPGNNPEAIQLLVDGLHISRIEIRDEQSMDLRAYIHKKASLRMRGLEPRTKCKSVGLQGAYHYRQRGTRES